MTFWFFGQPFLTCELLLEFDVVHELFLGGRIIVERSFQHGGLRQAGMCHDAPVLATAMRGLYVHAHVLTARGLHDLPADVVPQFFLQRASSGTPLCDACVLG